MPKYANKKDKKYNSPNPYIFFSLERNLGTRLSCCLIWCDIRISFIYNASQKKESNCCTCRLSRSQYWGMKVRHCFVFDFANISTVISSHSNKYSRAIYIVGKDYPNDEHWAFSRSVSCECPCSVCCCSFYFCPCKQLYWY